MLAEDLSQVPNTGGSLQLADQSANSNQKVPISQKINVEKWLKKTLNIDFCPLLAHSHI